MLSRKDFMAGCTAAVCGSGLCAQAAASPDTAGCDPKALKSAVAHTESAQFRFAKLVEQLARELPEEAADKILRGLGRQCAATYKTDLLDRFKGDIHGFLEEGRKNWMAQADYDEASGLIRIVDRQTVCVCPAVRQGMTPQAFCACTLGWQEAAYSAILGKPVKAELEESILRGGKRCVYRINVL